jgi:hypothetical protein
MIRDVHPGSRIWNCTIPYPGIKKVPDPQHCKLSSERLSYITSVVGDFVVSGGVEPRIHTPYTVFENGLSHHLRHIIVIKYSNIFACMCNNSFSLEWAKTYVRISFFLPKLKFCLLNGYRAKINGRILRREF